MIRACLIAILVMSGALSGAAQDCQTLVKDRFMIRGLPAEALAWLADAHAIDGSSSLRAWPDLGILVVEAPGFSAAVLQQLVTQALDAQGFESDVQVVPDQVVWRPLVRRNATGPVASYPSPWPADLTGSGVVVGVVDGPLFEREDLPATRVCCSEACPTTPDAHGTHVAGIIAGRRGIGKEGAGVAEGVTLLSAPFTTGHCDSLVEAIDAARCAILQGARIINCSWGLYDANGGLHDLIRKHPEVLFVAAAGNDGSEDEVYPAAFDEPNLIGTTFTYSYRKLTPKSQRGAWVDLGARGVLIHSTMGTTGTGPLTGSSMAAPFVAGAAALLMEKFPQLTAVEVRRILVDSASPRIAGIGGGMLDFEGALRLAEQNVSALPAAPAALSLPPPNPSSSPR